MSIDQQAIESHATEEEVRQAIRLRNSEEIAEIIAHLDSYLDPRVAWIAVGDELDCIKRVRQRYVDELVARRDRGHTDLKTS